MAKDVGQYVECPSCGAAVAAPDPDQDRPRYCSQCGTRFSARSGSVSGLLAFLGASGSTSTEEADVPAWPARGPAWDYRLLDVAARFGDRYRIERLLGRGAMGTVYLAWDERLHRHVALKVPHPDLGPELRERFEREARVAARIRHPNICPIHDVAALADGTPYLTMTYIEGQTLAAWSAAHGPLPGREAAVVVLQLARAMAEAHRHLVIHRDLKPTNVMVTPGGTLVIMDFGLAKRLDASETGVTQTKALIGTVAYMSPDQALEDVSAIGPGSDVYSLGVVLYELLTRRRPFEGGILAVLKAIAHAPPPPPSTLRPDIDPRLEAICLKAMAKDRDQRHETMSALARDLETFLAADEDASASNSGGPGLSTARQAFRATLPPESVVVEVPGSWCARPADLPEAEWVEVPSTRDPPTRIWSAWPNSGSWTSSGVSTSGNANGSPTAPWRRSRNSPRSARSTWASARSSPTRPSGTSAA
jgi:serine/threonine protein kinase